MSNQSALPAEQRLHTSVSLHGELHDPYLNGDPPGSEEPSGPPPSYTASHAFTHLDPDLKHGPAEGQGDPAPSNSPTQLPVDDLIGASVARRSLPFPPHQQQDSTDTPTANLRVEQQPNSTHKIESQVQSPQQKSADFPHRTQRPELQHTPRSTPDARKMLGKISELEEVDPFGNKFHEESPFAAGRQAQRAADRDATRFSSPGWQAYANGRFPSIRPGEIMPINTMQPTHGFPSFYPPLEAPPFPPTVQNPIRPAHFPPNLHPPAPEPTRTPSHQQPPSSHAQQLPQSHLYRASPPSQSAPVPAPPNPAIGLLHGQPSRELLRSHSQPTIPHLPQPQPTRSHSHQHAQLPNAPRQQQYTDAQPPSRRHTVDARDGVPPGLAPHGRYPVSQLPPADPPSRSQSQHHSQGPPSSALPSRSSSQHHLPGPPSRSPSQHHSQGPPLAPPSRSSSQQHPPGPPSRSQSQYQHHRPTSPPAPRDPHRSSLQAPPPSQVQFIPAPSPVRLPSQNVPTPQALGIVHSPPTDNSRPPRATPKPVMPQLLAPLVAQERNLERGAAGHLQRSVSSVTIQGQKGGFLSKTKSILRKRSSATGIRTHADGAISFAPTMPNLMEENGGDGRKLGKRLSRKK